MRGINQTISSARDTHLKHKKLQNAKPFYGVSPSGHTNLCEEQCEMLVTGRYLSRYSWFAFKWPHWSIKHLLILPMKKEEKELINK